MAKTNVKREKSKETDEVEDERVMSGGAKVDFTNITNKKEFNEEVDTFNKQVNDTVNSLKNAIDKYDAFIENKNAPTAATAAIAAINAAATDSGITQQLVFAENETNPETIYAALKKVYDGYQAIYESAKKTYTALNTQKV